MARAMARTMSRRRAARRRSLGTQLTSTSRAGGGGGRGDLGRGGAIGGMTGLPVMARGE